MSDVPNNLAAAANKVGNGAPKPAKGGATLDTSGVDMKQMMRDASRMDLPSDIDSDDGSDDAGLPMIDDATDADVDELLSGDQPSEEEGEPPAEEAAPEDEPAPEEEPAPEDDPAPEDGDPQPEAAPPKPPKQQGPTEIQQLTATVKELSSGYQNLIQNLPAMLAQSNQQFVATMAQGAAQQRQQQELQQRFEASKPKPLGPDATVEEVLTHRAETLEWNHAQRAAADDQRIKTLEQRLGKQEHGVRYEQATQQIDDALAQVGADPAYGWWMKHPVARNQVLTVVNSLVQSGEKFSPELVGKVSHQFLTFAHWFHHNAGKAAQAQAARGKPGAAAKPGQQAPAGRRVPPVRGNGSGAPGAGAQSQAQEDAEYNKWFGKKGGNRPSKFNKT